MENMVRVMATGVFDILHLGHLHFLEKAKELGDELVVVVAADRTAEKNKHTPITHQEIRLELIKALRVVDRAVLGNEGDPFQVVKKLSPDIIALGYDQHHNQETIKKKLKEIGLENTRIVRLGKFDNDLDGTRKIIGKIIREASRFNTVD